MVKSFLPFAQVDDGWLTERLGEWAACESPSGDPAAVNRMHDLIIASLDGEAGLAIERLPGPTGLGDTVLIRAGQQADGGTLVLGHVDTVHPRGTMDRELPIRREGDQLFGPGLYDMKGGVLCAVLALVEHARAAQTAPVTLLLSPDEEVGSPTTRPLIEHLARRSRRALVVEPARAGGAAVTARKGVGWFEVAVEGVPAHAGTHHADGRSAVREASRQVLWLEDMTDYAVGTTLSVGMIDGGTARNVVPSHCRFSVDVRVTSRGEADRIDAVFRTLEPIDPAVSIAVSGGFNRPPYEKSAGTAELLEVAVRHARAVGIALDDVPMVGGGSDGNFTAALGVPTLDGLGVEGGGAHTFGEHCLISSVVPRARLLTKIYAAP